MRRRNRVGWRLAGLLAGLSAVLAGGCASLGGPPEWVAKGARIEEGALYGVGSIQGVTNDPLAWLMAEQRARGAIARMLDSYVRLMAKDIAASSAKGSLDRHDEEQLLEFVQRTTTIVDLPGAEPVDRYYDERRRIHYVLVRLDKARATHTIAELGGLSERAREYVREHADRLFRELDEEIAKRGRPADPDRGSEAGRGDGR